MIKSSDLKPGLIVSHKLPEDSNSKKHPYKITGVTDGSFRANSLFSGMSTTLSVQSHELRNVDIIDINTPKGKACLQEMLKNYKTELDSNISSIKTNLNVVENNLKDFLTRNNDLLLETQQG